MNRRLSLAAALTLAAPLLLPALAGAQTVPPPGQPPTPQIEERGTLSVTGLGEVSAPPDMATLMIGVESRADTAAAAVAKNSEEAQAVIATLKAAGIDAKDLQTANFHVSPVYDETSYQRPEGPRIVGYQATNQVVAKVRDLDGLGEVLDAAVSSGANRIDGLSFGLEDDAEALDQARRRAVEDARRRAGIFAEAAGVELAGIHSIHEGGWSGPIPAGRDMMMRMEAAAAVPIERGQTTLTASVQIVWNIRTKAQ